MCRYFYLKKNKMQFRCFLERLENYRKKILRGGFESEQLNYKFLIPNKFEINFHLAAELIFFCLWTCDQPPGYSQTPSHWQRLPPKWLKWENPKCSHCQLNHEHTAQKPCNTTALLRLWQTLFHLLILLIRLRESITNTGNTREQRKRCLRKCPCN